MNNGQAFLRTQLPSAEPVSAFHAPLVVRLFHGFAFALLVLALLIASLASAQSTTGSIAAGTTLYQANCDSAGCHGATPGATASTIEILNAANAGGVINNAMGNSMGGYTTGSFTATQENDLAAYIATFVTQPNPVNSPISHNTATLINIPNLYINSGFGSFTTGTSSNVTRGSVAMSVSGSTLRATYTPTAGQCGTDTFNVRATNGGAYTSNLRSLSVDIADPATPNISTSVSPRTATYNLFSSFSPTSTGGASTNWDISSGALPTGMSINTTTGVISGIPTVVGSFVFTLRARNCLNGDLVGRSGTKSMTINVNKASQGAITALVNGSSAPTAFTYAPGAMAALTNTQLAPISTGAVSYAVTAATPTGTCTITSGTTLNLVTAGTCTVTVTRATDINYLVVTDTVNVTINKANQAALVAIATPPNVNFAANATLSTTGGSGTGLVSYASNNGNCSIASATLTGAAAGTCIVTATKAADTNYNAAVDATPTITVSAIVPGAPTGATAIGSDASATVSFTAPASNGGSAVTGYTVTSSPGGGVDTNAGSTLLNHAISGLTNGTPYTFTVRATNVIGQGAASSASNSVTPANTPVAPTITSANNKAFIVLTAGTSHSVTATGFPSPTISLFSGSLPAGVMFVGGTGSGVLSGTPSSGAAVSGAGGTSNYPVVFRAMNASGTVNQSFTITVNKLTQVMTFNPPAEQEFSPTPIPITATATLVPIIFSTSESSVNVSGATFTTLFLGAANLIADQAGNADYNAISSGKKNFTIVQGSQTISLPPQADQTYSPGGMFVLSGPPAASSGLPLKFFATNLTICDFANSSSPQATINSAGNCKFDITQDGDTNYLPASTLTDGVIINQASQTITWGAQSNRPFGVGAPFAISPLASGGASGNSITYDSLTPLVCTVTGITVSKVAVGICTLTANQSGNDNYTDAAQVQRSLAITASVPTAPTATQVTPSDSQIIVDFDPPVSNGGSAITGYTAACGPGGNTANGATSPITVTGLTNNTMYSCAVQATNAAGNSALSNLLAATPILATGVSLWTNVCANCHVGIPSGVRFNAAGTTGNVTNHVRSIQPTMLMQADVQALTLNELAEIEKYIATFVPAIGTSTAFNTPVMVDVASHLTLGTVSFTSAAVVSAPTNGSLSAFSGTQITYTPNPGFVGVDTFTYRGTHSGPIVNGDPRTVTITVNPPPIPVITSPAIAAGTFNTPFTYQITATNSPTSFGAAPLGGNFSINASGLISGTPMTTGDFMLTISATNAGGTGMQPVTVTISPANQSITFGAQLPRTYSFLGSFIPFPAATASSGLTISYSSLTPSVCTYIGPHYLMNTAGTCTLAANQPGNANYNAALQVTQNVVISPTVPDPPTIGTATPGSTVAAIGFTPPSNNGGSVITGYSALCNPGGLTGSNDASPVTVSGLTNDTLYTCAVRATNATGNSALSGTVTVTPTGTPVAPQISSANATTFTVGAPSTFTVTATGTPAPTLALVNPLPTGVTFTPATGVLAGTPALGQVGSYPLSITATGTAPAAMQSFTLTVQRADQTISFTGPASQPFTASTIPLTASASSGLTVALASNTPTVCTISVTTLTLLTVGTCSITASQTGDANYNAATSVTQGFSVTQATQTITFNAQVPANRSFVGGSTFAVNPLASASSNLAVIYSSITPGICSVVGINVTILAPGTCTIAANQSGSANFLAATQVTQNVSFNTTVPGAPTIGVASGGNAQATINFTAPASNGGSAIIDYTATCNVGGFSAVGSASPIIVSGLTNNTAYLCSVTARNSVGSSVASATVSVTPLSGQGSTLWTQVCDVCHTAVPAGNQLNGAGTTATVLNYVRANQNAMIFNSAVQALSASDLADIATYIASVIQPNDVVTTINTPVMVDVNNHITITNQAWSAFTNIEIVPGLGPTNGSLGSFTGTQILYTPTMNFTGIDSFTYRGKRTSGILYDGDPQTVTISVNPSPPTITSALSASGVFGQAFGYLITASNSPTSFDATPLPAGLSVSPAGLISGTPGESGQFSISISATNGGGSGGATLMLQIDPVAQLITFGAQTSPRTFAANGMFAISPVATGGGSGNPIMYGTNTPSVCTVSGTTVTIVAAGICTITADQAGGTNFAAAVQATQNVTISPVAPSAPGIIFGTPGNTQATIAFTPSASTGGSPITNYTATCGAMSATGAGSPIVVSGLTNGVQVMCSVTATGPGGTSAASGNVNVTPAAITVPGAPTITAITPGDSQASIAFSAPASDGGSVITSYTATCLPGGIINNGTVSPLVVTGLTNGQTYTCFLAASNVAGPGPNSAGVDVTPQSSLVFMSVVSRKTHGAAGNFDVPINPLTIPTGLVDVDPRIIGAGHTLVFSFNNPITAAGAVSTTAGSAVSVASGNDVVVTLTTVPDNSRVTVTLTNVNGVPTPFAASMGFLVGDVNATRSVSASDISGVKARSGQTTTGANFRFDVNATGAINASDISAVKARSGLTLPP